MKFDIREKLAKLDESLPPRQTAMLPSEAFFCFAAEIPQGALQADVGGFAQIELESRAPFPVENLAWGYLASEGRALVFAATFERASAGLEKGLEPVLYALPAFLPFCLETHPSADTVRICVSGHSASALYMNAGKSLPSKIVSCKLAETFDAADGAAALKARSAIIEKLGVGKESGLEEGIRVLRNIDSGGEETVAFATSLVGPSRSATTARISGDALWNADVRGRTFAASTRDLRRKDYFAWMAFAAEGWAAAFLALATIAAIAFSIVTGVYHSAAKKHRAEVENLQNKSDFATSLENVTEREMKPFSMIAEASLKRPGGLCFDKVSSSDWDTLVIEGRAERSELVQTYIEQLGKDPNVREVRTLSTATSGGRSTFSIEIVFKPLEEISTGSQPSTK